MIRNRAIWRLGMDIVLFGPLVAAVVFTFLTGGQSILVGLSVGLGMLTTSVLVIVVVLVSRVRGISRALGLVTLTGLHRRLGALLVGLVLAHVVAAVAADPRGLALLDVVHTTGGARSGIVATVAILVPALLVFPRSGARWYAVRVRIHAAAAVVAVVFAALHILLLQRLVENPVMAAIFGALFLLVLVVLIRRWVIGPVMGRGAHVVAEVRPESGTTSTVVLEPTKSRHAIVFEPGQFVWVRLHRDLPFTAEHPFTVSGSTPDGGVELTVRAHGAFSEQIRRLEPGSKVWLDGPHGGLVPSIVPGPSADPHPAESANPGAEPVSEVGDPGRRDAGEAALVRFAATPDTGLTTAPGIVLVAGGVGVTPIISILRALADADDPRSHYLVISDRPGESLFAEEIDELAGRLSLQVTRTEGRSLDVAFLGSVLPTGARARYDYFVSGPEGLEDDVIDVLIDCGVPFERIVVESFG